MFRSRLIYMQGKRGTMRNRLKVLGLTGKIAAGKSAVSNILREKNGYILDADEIAHLVILKGGSAYDEILAKIPGDYLDKNGEIDRSRLGEKVFAEKVYLTLLENAVHKHVLNNILSEIDRIFNNPGGYRFIVIDAALLIESGASKNCDEMWIVTARRETRRARLMARSGCTREQAEARLNARLLIPPEDCVIIENDGSIDELNKKVLIKLSKFLER